MTTTLTLDPLQAETVAQPRGVERLVAGTATSDGAGVKLTRVLTQHAAAPARPVPDARRVRHRQPGRLHRRLSRPSAPRLRDRDLHDRRPHAPPRQRRQRGPAAERRRAVDDRRPRRGPLASCPSRRTAAWKASSSGSTCRPRDKMRAPWYRDIQSDEIPRVQSRRGRDRARDRRAQPRRGRARCSARRPQPLYLDLQLARRRELRADAAGRAQRLRLRLPRRARDRRAARAGAAHGDPAQRGRRRGAACAGRTERARC